MSRRLTKNRLKAIAEALTARLAGEFAAEFGPEYDGQSQEVYKDALDWANEELTRRETSLASTSPRKPGPGPRPIPGGR